MSIRPAVLILSASLLAGAASAADRKVVTPAGCCGSTPRYAGLVYVEPGLAGALFGARYRWHARTRVVEIGREGRLAQFRIGDRTATVNGQRVRLSRAPYILHQHAMLPLRLVGDALGIPVAFEAQSASVTIGPTDDVLWTVPLVTSKTGFVLHSPTAGSEWRGQVRIHGQRKNAEGDLVLQLQSADGEVISEGKLPARPRGTGTFTEFISFLLHARSPGRAYPARVVVFIRGAQDGQPLQSVSVPITFHEE